MADDPGWTPKQDMSLLCRVCANQHDYLIPIFEGEGLDHDMPTKMDKHLPIKVRENDKLPTQMCYQCASTIIAWSELVTNCLEADKKLSRMLKINEKKSVTAAIADEDEHSDHYEDTYDDVGGGDDDDTAAAPDDEDFEKEIKQLISDAGVELVSKSTKSKTIRTSTRKRKSETVTVKKESKKSKTDSSVNKSSTSLSLIKPKEEVTSSDDRYNTCEHCKLVFPSKSELIIHKEQQHPVEHFVCDICKETFLIKTQLRRHIKWHGKSKAMKKFRTCPLCPEIFPRYSGSKTLYHEHMRIVHNETISMSKRASAFKLCTCEVCGKLFKSKLKLKAHLLVHVEGKPFHCKETGCNAKFNQTKQIDKHVHLVHEEATKGNFAIESDCTNVTSSACACEVCGKQFSSPHALRRHKRQHHQRGKQKQLKKYNKDYFKRLKPKMCPQCGKIVKNLANHLKLHSNEKFQCHHCQKEFNRIDYLKIHLRIHTGERPFICYVCGNGFKQHGDMNKHIRTVHKVEPVMRNYKNNRRSFMLPN